MKILLKRTESEISEMVVENDRSGACIYIDGCFVAIFRDDGTFTFHGQGTSHKFDGRWDLK